MPRGRPKKLNSLRLKPESLLLTLKDYSRAEYVKLLKYSTVCDSPTLWLWEFIWEVCVLHESIFLMNCVWMCEDGWLWSWCATPAISLFSTSCQVPPLKECSNIANVATISLYTITNVQCCRVVILWLSKCTDGNKQEIWNPLTRASGKARNSGNVTGTVQLYCRVSFHKYQLDWTVSDCVLLWPTD